MHRFFIAILFPSSFFLSSWLDHLFALVVYSLVPISFCIICNLSRYGFQWVKARWKIAPCWSNVDASNYMVTNQLFPSSGRNFVFSRILTYGIPHLEFCSPIELSRHSSTAMNFSPNIISSQKKLALFQATRKTEKVQDLIFASRSN